MRAALSRLVHFLLLAEGSTRGVALIRIGLVALLWTKWGGDFLLFLDKPPDQRAIATAFYVSTFFLFFGMFTRVAAAGVGISTLAIYYWIGFHDGVEPYTHHHTGLLALAAGLLALTPSGGSWSVDRWWSVRRARARGLPIPAERGPLWGQRLIALQVSVLYLSTGIDKCTRGFLSGERLQHHLMSLYFGSDYPSWAPFPYVCQALALVTVALELGLAVGLWFRPTRRVLIPLGIVFHAVLYVMLPVSTFSLTMWLLYLAFVDPDDLHHFVDRLGDERAP